MLSFYLSDAPEPQRGKSAPIQKGLLPRPPSDSIELCGEGLGFGTPILQYRRDFYFPGSAIIYHEEREATHHWIKVFQFNLIERKQHGPLPSIDTFSWTLPRLHNRIYKTRTGRQFLKLFAVLTDKGFQRLGKQFAPHHFIPVESRGESRCHFLLSKRKRDIDIQIRFDTIVRNNLQFIFIANELDGRHFSRYWDSSELYLKGNQIEPWAKIAGRWAIFYAPVLNFGFRVNIPKGATAFRGREVFAGQGIFWSGILLRFPKSTTTCQYQIQYGTLKQLQEEPSQ